MPLQNPERVVTKQDLKDFYDAIYPYLGGGASFEELIAHVEADATSASKAYEIGDQLILGGVLYTATAAIAIGDALENGTNLTLSDDITTQIDKKADSATTVAGYGITDAYTKSEVDNKLSTIETNIDWKEAVATYADIATTYPNPQDGWTVNVKDTDYTYRYNGTAWVAISANAIPEATTSVNGLMTTNQVSKLDGIESGAEANVQVDWSQATTTADDYIKNKPTLGTAAAKDSTNAVASGSTDLVESGTVYNALANKADAPTIKTATLTANATTVTFTGMPTTGNNIIDFYIDGGANYTAINTATSGQVTLTYDAESSARTVYCEIKEVS